jgi:hypothetical protein
MKTLKLTDRDFDFIHTLVEQYLRKREKSLAKLADNHPIRPRVEKNIDFASSVLSALDRQNKGSTGEGDQ